MNGNEPLTAAGIIGVVFGVALLVFELSPGAVRIIAGLLILASLTAVGFSLTYARR